MISESNATSLLDCDVFELEPHRLTGQVLGADGLNRPELSNALYVAYATDLATLVNFTAGSNIDLSEDNLSSPLAGRALGTLIRPVVPQGPWFDWDNCTWYVHGVCTGLSMFLRAIYST